MVDKTKYIKRIQELYKTKTGIEISDDIAFEYFEKLVLLVSTITSHTNISKLIVKTNENRKLTENITTP